MLCTDRKAGQVGEVLFEIIRINDVGNQRCNAWKDLNLKVEIGCQDVRCRHSETRRLAQDRENWSPATDDTDREN